MITIVGLDGTYYAIRNERIAADILAALPHLIPVSFNPAITPVKESPKVQDRSVGVDVVLVHEIKVRKVQLIEKEVGRLAGELEQRFAITVPSGGAKAVVDTVLGLLGNHETPEISTATFDHLAAELRRRGATVTPAPHSGDFTEPQSA